MKLLRTNADHFDGFLVSIVSQQIREGAVIIYPTDTVYGIGCSIDKVDSVKRIFEIKCREQDKPLSVAFPSIEMAKKYAEISPADEDYMKEHINEPLTFVVKKKPSVPDFVTAGLDTVGIRIPDNEVLRKMLTAADMPIITTSVNFSGQKAPTKVGDIDMRIIEQVDLVIDSGPCRIGKPSKVIDLASGKVLR
jgi:L-threonylcarbamoyladenylate synthase